MNFGDHAQAFQPVEIARREDLRIDQSHAAVARAVGLVIASIMSSITPRASSPMAWTVTWMSAASALIIISVNGPRLSSVLRSGETQVNGRQWPRFFFSGSLL